MITPLESEYWNNVTQKWGNPDPILYPMTGYHIGTDFGCRYNTPIIAPKDCTVTRIGYSDALGYWCEVLIDDWYMVCLHLKGPIKVKAYKQGDTIANVGVSGKIEGVHSHLESWYEPMNRSKLNKNNWNTLTFDILTKFN